MGGVGETGPSDVAPPVLDKVIVRSSGITQGHPIGGNAPPPFMIIRCQMIVRFFISYPTLRLGS